MASLIHKRKKGRLYTYWVESARVKGQPRIVEQIYLGPKERVLKEIKAAYTRGQAPGPSPLKQLRGREFGASALLWHWAQKLGLVEIINRHVPPVEVKRRTPLSVGDYLVLAALNRCIDVRSKRALYVHWYQDSVISRLRPASAGELTSQRFWDHMDQVEEAHIEVIQHELLARLQELFPLGPETMLYDTTNYFTFIDTFNERTQLAQRGHNKQKRHDLRQLSLALFEDQDTGLPLYHQCYAGHRPDTSHFATAWQGMVQAWMKGLERAPQQLTLIFDPGNSSKENIRRLEAASIHYVGALPIRWVPELLAVDLSAYEKLTLPGTKHVKAYRCRHRLWGKERTLLVVFSPTLYGKQRATLNRMQKKVEAQLQDLAQAIATHRRTRKGSGYRPSSVEKKIRAWTAREHLDEFLDVAWKTEQGKVVELSWRWDRKRKRAVQRRYLGKRVLFTDHEDWNSVRIVTSYRKLWKTEGLFRLSKGGDGPWWPMFHWTDSKIRVHALYCYFALVLLSIVQMKLREAGIPLNVERALDRLQRIQETWVIYRNGAGERVLSDMDEGQWQLARALGVIELARQMGNTVLEPK